MIHIHVDVDNLWIYEQEYGVTIHKNREHVFTQCLPTFLKLLDKSKSKATFSIVGRDLDLASCRTFCKNASNAGHEIINHTWDHDVSFGHLSYKEKQRQISEAHKKISQACGKPPVGFRGPGYYQNQEIVTILHNMGYAYDTSVLPGFAHFLMSFYARIKGVNNTHKSFGRSEYILRPSKPKIIRGLKSNETLIELPISVLPLLRLPIHTTFAYAFGSQYQNIILHYIQSRPRYMIYLFHGIDFINIPKLDDNYPVVPLRYSYEYRINFARKIIDALIIANGGPLQTSRDAITNYIQPPLTSITAPEMYDA